MTRWDLFTAFIVAACLTFAIAETHAVLAVLDGLVGLLVWVIWFLDNNSVV